MNAVMYTITIARLRISLVIMVLAYLLTVVSSNKIDMMIKTARESSIKMNNFVSMLDVSFNTSNCCNVLISGESTTTEILLKEFFKVYPYEYTLNQRTYYCNGYLLISTSIDGVIAEMKSVPTRISTTELLIVLDSDVEESTGLFNVSMYDNANVNIVTPNGLWTLEKDFLLSSVFKKISSHNEIMDKQRVINLKGRELIAAAYYRAPMCYLQSSENRTVKGIEGEYFIAKNETEIDGIEVKLFMLIAERLNFTWTIRKVTDKRKYGQLNGTEWRGGMIGQLIRKEVDITFTKVWLMIDKYIVTNLTVPWGDVVTKFLVPRPKPYTNFWALTRPLSPAVWIVFLVILILQSIYIYTIAWLPTKIPKRFRIFVIALTELMGILIGSWYPKKMKNLHLLLQLWNFFGILIVIAYSSSLASSLTNRRYEKKIDTTQDFIEANLTWGTEILTPTFHRLLDYSDPYSRQFFKYHEYENGEADRHRKILKGNYAIIGTTILSIFFPDNDIRNEDLNGFRVMKQSVNSFKLSFAVQSWLLTSVDVIMLRLHETGLVEYHINDVLHRRTGSALYKVLVDYESQKIGPRVLHLIPLGAGFLILIVGLFISTVVFFFELKSVSKNGSIRQVLMEIKNNRSIYYAKELKRKQEDSRFRRYRRKKLACAIPQ